MDALELLLSTAKSAPKLSIQEEHGLIRRAQSGDRAASDRVLRSNLRYVVQIAYSMIGYGVPMDDLIAEGSEAMVRCLAKFDCDRGFRFITYAGYYIRASVSGYVRVKRDGLGGGFGTKSLRYDAFYKIKRQRARFEALGIPADEILQRLAALFRTTEAKIGAVVARHAVALVSTDAPVDPSSTITVEDRLADPGPRVDDVLDRTQTLIRTTVQAHTALQILSARERRIIEARIMAEESTSLSSLAVELGVSRERVRQIEARALEKMRHLLAPATVTASPADPVVRLIA